MDNAEHFEVERFTRRMILASPWIFVALTTLLVALALLPDDGKPRDDAFQLALSIILALVFGGLAALSWRVARELPFAAVSLDAHGIWMTAKNRGTSLVQWSDVARLRERPYLQRLELLDRMGGLLFKLEYQLDDFERLRRIVLQRSSLVPIQMCLGQTFAKSFAYHAFNAAALASFTALGFYIWPTNELLGTAVLLAVVGGGSWEYLTTAHKVELRPTEMLISSPLKKLALSREDIVALDVSDVIVKGARHPQVLLAHTKSKKPIALRDLGSSAVELKLALESWQRNA